MMCAFSWTGFGTVKFDVAAVVMLHVPVGITVSVHDIAGRQTSARTSAMRRDGPILSASECERLAPPERAAAPTPRAARTRIERGVRRLWAARCTSSLSKRARARSRWRVAIVVPEATPIEV